MTFSKILTAYVFLLLFTRPISDILCSCMASIKALDILCQFCSLDKENWQIFMWQIYLLKSLRVRFYVVNKLSHPKKRSRRYLARKTATSVTLGCLYSIFLLRDINNHLTYSKYEERTTTHGGHY